MKTSVHENSLETHDEILFDKAKLMDAIVQDVTLFGKGTVKQIALRMGFKHRSEIQPRVSELRTAKRLKEVGKIKDFETNKSCMVIDIPNREPKQTCFYQEPTKMTGNGLGVV